MMTLLILPQGPESHGRILRTDTTAGNSTRFAKLLGQQEGSGERSRPEARRTEIPDDSMNEGRDGPEGHAATERRVRQANLAAKLTGPGSDMTGPAGVAAASETAALQVRRSREAFSTRDGSKATIGRVGSGSAPVSQPVFLWHASELAVPADRAGYEDPLRDHGVPTGTHDLEKAGGQEQVNTRLAPAGGSDLPLSMPIAVPTHPAMHPLSMVSASESVAAETLSGQASLFATKEMAETELVSKGLRRGQTKPAIAPQAGQVTAIIPHGHQTFTTRHDLFDGSPRLPHAPANKTGMEASAGKHTDTAAALMQQLLARPDATTASIRPTAMTPRDAVALHEAMRSARYNGAAPTNNSSRPGASALQMPLQSPSITKGVATGLPQDPALRELHFIGEDQDDIERPATLMSGRVDQAGVGLVSARQTITPAQTLSGLVQRIADVIQNPDQKVIRIQLSPLELGRVRISLNPTELGLHIVVQSERPETQDLLRRNAAELERELSDLGFEDLSLDFSNRQDRSDLFEPPPSSAAGPDIEQTGDAEPAASAMRRAVQGAGGLDVRF